jgi:hypothetical protein
VKVKPFDAYANVLKETSMKWLTSCVLITAATAACNTMRPIDGSPTELRRLIERGDLVKHGDRIRVVTADELSRRITVTKIEAGRIIGSNESVCIENVISLEIQSVRSTASIQLDTKTVTDWLVTLGAFALRPITVEATP